MSRTLLLLSFLLTVCLISKSDASEKHGDVMARPRLLLTTTTRKNISSEYTSTSHDQTITGVLNIIGSTVDAGENSGTPYLFTLRGSDVAASSGVSVEAGGDISITVADASSSSDVFDEKTRSGFSFSGGGGGIGISYGKSEQGKNARDDSDYHVGSLLGTENGDVTLNAGKDVSVESSQIVSGTGDVAISGENITIENEYDTYDSSYREYSKDKSIGISIGLTGPVVDAVTGITNAVKTAEKAKDASTDRAGILY